MATGTPTLPYAHLNLRWNPFGEPPREDVVRLAVVELESAVARLRAAVLEGTPWALQLLGPGGCGKTTHLAWLRACFPDAAVLEWTPRGWRPPAASPLLLVDDAHEVSAPELRQSLRGRVAAVLATRSDLGDELRAVGFPHEEIRVDRRVSSDLLRSIVARRLEWARRGDGPLPPLGERRLGELSGTHGPDVRAVLDGLYDGVQDWAGSPPTESEAE